MPSDAAGGGPVDPTTWGQVREEAVDLHQRYADWVDHHALKEVLHYHTYTLPYKALNVLINIFNTITTNIPKADGT